MPPDGAASPPPVKKSSKRKKTSKRKPKSFVPSAELTSGITEEMRNTKTSEEFENDLQSATVNRMVENVRSVIPSLSDISLAWSTASKSVSNLSVAAVDAAQKASKSVSDLSVAATGAAQKAGAALSDVSQKVADGAKVAMDTAAAAKEAYKAATEPKGPPAASSPAIVEPAAEPAAPPAAPAAETPTATAVPAATTPTSAAAVASIESSYDSESGIDPTAPAEPATATPGKKRRRPRAFTVGITDEMRKANTAEEFENDLDAKTVNRMMINVRSVIPSLSDLQLAWTTASKSVSDLSVAAVDAAQKASKSVSDLSVAATGAAQKASEHAFTIGAAISDMSSKVADGAAAAKQRTTDAYQAARDGATAMQEKVSAASKSLSETTTALMEGAAAVGASVQENVKKAQEVSKAAMESAAPVVSAVSSGVAAAASSVSDVAVAVSSASTTSVSDTNVSTAPSSDLKQSLANKFSHLSKSLSSIWGGSSAAGASGGGSTPRLEFSNNREKNESEMVALADLCPMPAVAYKASNRSPPTSEGGGGSGRGDLNNNNNKCSITNESTIVYDCDIEQTHQQSTGTNSFESIVLIKDNQINDGQMVKHPVIGQHRQAMPVQLITSDLGARRVEEWALRQLERAEGGDVPALAVPHTRLGDREHWLLQQITTRIQNKFTSMKRHDFTLSIKRGYAKNGLPYLEVEVTPI